jgi:hypothetical protein
MIVVVIEIIVLEMKLNCYKNKAIGFRFTPTGTKSIITK